MLYVTLQVVGNEGGVNTSIEREVSGQEVITTQGGKMTGRTCQQSEGTVITTSVSTKAVTTGVGTVTGSENYASSVARPRDVVTGTCTGLIYDPPIVNVDAVNGTRPTMSKTSRAGVGVDTPGPPLHRREGTGPHESHDRDPWMTVGPRGRLSFSSRLVPTPS